MACVKKKLYTLKYEHIHGIALGWDKRKALEGELTLKTL